MRRLRVVAVRVDVRYACGLFDGPTCVGLAEAVGSCHATDADGKPVDLAAALEPFRLRG